MGFDDERDNDGPVDMGAPHSITVGDDGRVKVLALAEEFHDLHPMSADPALAHLNFTAYAEPESTLISRHTASPDAPC